MRSCQAICWVERLSKLKYTERLTLPCFQEKWQLSKVDSQHAYDEASPLHVHSYGVQSRRLCRVGR